MTPRQAVDRLRGLCDDRERRGRAGLTFEEVRGIIDDVAWPPDGLTITEDQAGILLALIGGRVDA